MLGREDNMSIYDPVVTGGCPQCGTFRYKHKSKTIRSEAVHSGMNLDVGDYKDDRQVRCGRCGFICNVDRDLHANDGSRIGWGIKYDVQ